MSGRLKRLLEMRFRISTQLYLGIGGAVALTLAASLVGWFSFNRVGDVQDRVNEGSVPEMAAAFGIAQFSGTLVAAAPRLTTATRPEDFARVSADIDETHQAFEEQLAVFEQKDASDERFMQIRGHADDLLLSIDEMKSQMSRFADLDRRSEQLRLELDQLITSLDGIIVPAIDDQLFYTMTGYRNLGEPPASYGDHFSGDEFDHYRHLADLQATANISTQFFASAFSLSDSSFIEPLKERFEAAAGSIERSLSSIQGSQLHVDLAPVFARLIEVGLGDDSVGLQGGFDLLQERLDLAQSQREKLADNREIAVRLVAEVDGLVNTARESVEEATLASTQATLTGRTLLLGITAASVGGALLIAWLFVGRVLLRRLQMLSVWMRRMAGGDLESRVEIGGRDEVADMAAALEVFRLHALEVQRLNLVEKMAAELQGKNDQLESVLADLRRAQDQIVMREKLAALGELTAGVAHEIRNPLNFVKNFSEVSEELLTELAEAIEESGEKLTEDQVSLIKDITDDLVSNLSRIRSHGDRANRIVHGMLLMGRGSGDMQSTDINKLLDEHARLAYHSARATDPNFQLDLQSDLDPDAGEIEVIPQDLGRVFLNIVGNACDATDERRRAETEKGGEPYSPTLYLATRRGEDNVEIRIKDNGNGIPTEVVEKIFNPFFTTKPTDRGTGLGLAISSDIVRQHGGNIRVDSEIGQFTEFTISLPLVRSQGASLEAAEPDRQETPAL